MRRDVRRTLEDVITRIVASFRPHKIILFGSYAEGNAGPDSDLDLLIILDVKGSIRQAANEIDRLFADRCFPMDFIVLKPEQFERQKEISGTLAYQIERSGKIVYESAA